MTVGPQRRRGRVGADDWVERVRDASDLVEVVSQSVQLRRQGKSWVGLCPFHGEKTPSFTVSPERQLYHCFSCKAGGDVFRFVQETEKIGFLEAAELLSRRAGIPVPERRGEGGGVRHAILEALSLAAEAYEQWLRDPGSGEGARAYLESRGLSTENVRAFRLGLAPEGWQNLVDRLRNRVSEDVLLQAGLAARRDQGRGLYDRFRNRLMVPLVAPGGEVVGFGARALGEENPKYLNSPETVVYRKSAFVFALDQARRALGQAGELVVVEGYFDVFALHQAGVRNVVATSGTALTSDHARVFKRLTQRVALTFDGDAAGREAALRSIGLLLSEGLEVAIVDLPPGQDPDTWIRARGREGWNERRSAAYDAVEFVYRYVQRAALDSGSTPADALERSLRAVVGLAGAISDPLRVRLLSERASEVFGVDASVLRRSLSLRPGEARIQTPLRASVLERQRREEGLEQALLRALLHAPEAVDGARQRLSPEDFRDDDARALALWIWSGNQGLPEEEPAATLARGLAVGGASGLDWAAEAEGAARRMVERRLRQQLRERRNRLGQAAAGPEAARLMQEIDEIARSLREMSA